MATAKVNFLRTPYGAYLHRDIPNEDKELTHVGPGTPCGEYMRRFWQPIPIPIDKEDLTDLPVRVRLLGEDLVVFRDKSGRPGLLELHCSHRGTSLEFGLIEHTGIRCCYHGWLFGVDGKILETPGEPPDSTYKERLCHGAYPVHEWNDMLFTYMGPPDKIHPFPMYDDFDEPGWTLAPGRRELIECNWLQIADNVMDASHTAFLHTRSSGGQFFNETGEATQEFGEVGELDWISTPIGVAYVNTRRIGNEVWVRMSEINHPNLQQTPGNPVFPHTFADGETEKCFGLWFTKWIVPIDDTHVMSIHMTHILGKQKKNYTDPVLGPSGGNNDDRAYEERQRNPSDYEAEISQRPIAIHAMERLGFTDRGVVMFRKELREGIRAVQRGADPKGLDIIKNTKGLIPTYASDTILLLPPAPTPEEDSKLLRATGRTIAAQRLKNPPHLNGYAK
jgi:phenylpropionate dioxygenase-like ring-hydroxylating dioxygenase large terminal subunit